MSADGGTKAVVAALLANTGIAISKFVAYGFTGSSSMLSEAFHSVADSGNQALLLIGRKRAQRARTPRHPFGYGRERYFYAFIVTVVLFSVGALFSLYEGWKKIDDPHQVESPEWAFGVLIAAIIMETLSFRTAIVESNRVRGNASWVHFVRHAKAPELPVVLLEDLGALLGLVFALVGVTLAVVTGNGVWDGVGSIAIGVLLALIAWVLSIETKSLLIGEGASEETVTKIIAALEDGPEVERVIHLKTQHLGPEELLVAAKIAVADNNSGTEIARGIDAAERRVRAAVPIAEMIYLEPDLYRTAPTPPSS